MLREERGKTPGEVVFVGTESFAAAAHVGGRVDAANGSRKGHEAPAAVLAHLAIHQVPCRQRIRCLSQHLSQA